MSSSKTESIKSIPKQDSKEQLKMVLKNFIDLNIMDDHKNSSSRASTDSQYFRGRNILLNSNGSLRLTQSDSSLCNSMSNLPFNLKREPACTNILANSLQNPIDDLDNIDDLKNSLTDRLVDKIPQEDRNKFEKSGWNGAEYPVQCDLCKKTTILGEDSVLVTVIHRDVLNMLQRDSV